MNSDTKKKKANEVHHGRNVKRFREMFGIKQDVLADTIGVSQQTVSRYESRKELKNEVLNKLANGLQIPVEAIKNFDEKTVRQIISNANNLQMTDNPNSLSEKTHLSDGNTMIYERFLKIEQEMSALREKIVLEGKWQ